MHTHTHTQCMPFELNVCAYVLIMWKMECICSEAHRTALCKKVLCIEAIKKMSLLIFTVWSITHSKYRAENWDFNLFRIHSSGSFWYISDVLNAWVLYCCLHWLCGNNISELKIIYNRTVWIFFSAWQYLTIQRFSGKGIRNMSRQVIFLRHEYC